MYSRHHTNKTPSGIVSSICQFHCSHPTQPCICAVRGKIWACRSQGQVWAYLSVYSASSRTLISAAGFTLVWSGQKSICAGFMSWIYLQKAICEWLQSGSMNQFWLMYRLNQFWLMYRLYQKLGSAVQTAVWWCNAPTSQTASNVNVWLSFDWIERFCPIGWNLKSAKIWKLQENNSRRMLLKLLRSGEVDLERNFKTNFSPTSIGLCPHI